MVFYRYQDTQDSRIDHWIAQHEHGLRFNNISHHINFADAELHLWLRMQAWISTRKSRQRFLDVGCGLGRIVDRFGWLFRETICLEADPNRASQAARGERVRAHLWELSRSTGRLSHVNMVAVEQRFVNGRFLDRHDWNGGQEPDKFRAKVKISHQFDTISMIHVIQHIPTYKVQLWLEKAHHMLGRNGLLILATTLGNISSLKLEGHVRELMPSSFNAIASGSTPSHEIPVRVYTANELRGLVRGAGLQILEQSPFVYHVCTHVPESQFVIATPAKLSGGYDTPADPPVDALYLSQPMIPSIRRQWALREKFRKRCGH